MFTHPKCGGQHSTVQQARDCEAAKQTATKQWQPANSPIGIPDVPGGHYAVPSATGNNDLDFYRVDRPTEGRWKGYTFVKRVIGGNPDAPVRGPQARVVLSRILLAGVEDSRRRYGQHIGRCALCNRHLTDEESRVLGLGPECRKKV